MSLSQNLSHHNFLLPNNKDKNPANTSHFIHPLVPSTNKVNLPVPKQDIARLVQSREGEWDNLQIIPGVIRQMSPNWAFENI